MTSVAEHPQAAWSALPPLQRTLGAPTLTSAPATFAAGLAAWRSAALTGVVSRQVDLDMPLRSGPNAGSTTPRPAGARPVAMPLVPRAEEPQVQRTRDGYAGDPPPAQAYPSRPLVTASTAGMPLVQLVAESLPEPRAAATESDDLDQPDQEHPVDGADGWTLAPAEPAERPAPEPTMPAVATVSRLVDPTARPLPRPRSAQPALGSARADSALSLQRSPAPSESAEAPEASGPESAVHPEAPPGAADLSMPLVVKAGPGTAAGTTPIQRHVDEPSRPAETWSAPAPAPGPSADPPGHASPAPGPSDPEQGPVGALDAHAEDLGEPIEPEPPQAESDSALPVVPGSHGASSADVVALQRDAADGPIPPTTATPTSGSLAAPVRLGLGAPLSHPTMSLVQRTSAPDHAGSTTPVIRTADRAPSGVAPADRGAVDRGAPDRGAADRQLVDPPPVVDATPPSHMATASETPVGSGEAPDHPTPLVAVALDPVREPDLPALSVVQRRVEPEQLARADDESPPAAGESHHWSGDGADTVAPEDRAAASGVDPIPANRHIPPPASAPDADLAGLPQVAALAPLPSGQPHLTLAPVQRTMAASAGGGPDAPRAPETRRTDPGVVRVQRAHNGDSAPGPAPRAEAVSASSAWPVATLPRQRALAPGASAPVLPLGPARRLAPGMATALVEPDAPSAPSSQDPLDLPLGIPPTLQRAAENPTAATDSDLVHRDVVVDLPRPGADGIPAVQRVIDDDPQAAAAPIAADAPAGPSGANGGASSEQVDELAHRLYEPLMSRLRADLLIERERHGRLTDAW
ncbi:MAG: hypothetical protein V9G08_12600 [Dermatophilaceae bacterium]